MPSIRMCNDCNKTKLIIVTMRQTKDESVILLTKLFDLFQVTYINSNKIYIIYLKDQIY